MVLQSEKNTINMWQKIQGAKLRKTIYIECEKIFSHSKWRGFLLNRWWGVCMEYHEVSFPRSSGGLFTSKAERSTFHLHRRSGGLISFKTIWFSSQQVGRLSMECHEISFPRRPECLFTSKAERSTFRLHRRSGGQLFSHSRLRGLLPQKGVHGISRKDRGL